MNDWYDAMPWIRDWTSLRPCVFSADFVFNRDLGCTLVCRGIGVDIRFDGQIMAIRPVSFLWELISLAQWYIISQWSISNPFDIDSVALGVIDLRIRRQLVMLPSHAQVTRTYRKCLFYWWKSSGHRHDLLIGKYDRQIESTRKRCILGISIWQYGN